jgi:sensor c-di-GMP phosphodiesterase-like protein
MGKNWPYIVLAVLVLFAPLAGSWYAAGQWSQQAEFDQTHLMALSVLRRADDVAEQAEAAQSRLEAARGANPCSPANLALMREIDLGSSQLLAVGYVDGDHLLCSSLGVHDPPISLGPPRYINARGLELRPALHLSLTSGRPRVVGVRHGTAVVLAPELITDLYPDMRSIVVGVVTRTGVQIAGRGGFSPMWLQRLGRATAMSFVDGPHVVSLQRSARFDLVTYVAVPAGNIQKRANALFAKLLPLALLVGAISCFAVLWRAREQRTLPAMIRSALRHGEFFLNYQPIVELATGRWVGAEALIRWQRPDGSQVRPDVFVPVAEDSGIIVLLSRHVLELLARDAPAILALRPDFRFSVNLSQQDLTNPLTIDELRGLLASGLKPTNLAIEATERGVMEKEAAAQVLRQIRALGMRVAIDDFGTGYANLAYLHNFEVDSIKIDKSFVNTIGTEAATAHVALLIIELGKTLSLDMVAEGVEQPHQADYLRDNGVRYGQGWLFARPMPAEGLRAALTARSRAATPAGSVRSR